MLLPLLLSVFLTTSEAPQNDSIKTSWMNNVSVTGEKRQVMYRLDRRRIAAFFDTEIGRKLRSGTPYIREFKFSILDDGGSYGEGLAGEQVLLQGVVDCALLEPDGITVIDFKTDRVTEENLSVKIAQYRPQVETYAEALGRIFEQKIKGCYLYFFRINRFVEI